MSGEDNIVLLDAEPQALVRGRLRAVVATARPRQWIKNLLVIAAPAAAGALGHDDVPVRVVLACAAFCMLASGIYAINDVRDAEEDRLHPRKRLRPVAAGELSPRAATTTGIASIAAGLLLCVGIRPLLGLVGLGYVVLTVSYTMLWRHVAGLDVLAVAGGFVLRAVGGGVAAPVTLSSWFLLVITFGAILAAAGKRHSELCRPGRLTAGGRAVLRRYSPTGLQLILLGSALGALAAYCAWAFAIPTVDGIPWRPLTILPFALALLRYGWHLRRGSGEAPEDVLLNDRRLQLISLVWLILFAFGVNAES
ncbi:MAG TPA: decaprenyl-phosphate phosphoribosyltransferase [Solirubrobacteraceae bacterium]|jgi:decaprenyl-phosphate phosphoribosyltransferase|nr:decaprenyl-phosphate phosphoribosyltransferase [Solirubrobacteraceae bacterium]